MSKEQLEDLILLIEKFNAFDKKTLKKNIRKYYQSHKEEYDKTHYGTLTYKMFSEQVGVGMDTFSMWLQLNKTLSPNFINALKLCRTLDITIEQLLVE